MDVRSDGERRMKVIDVTESRRRISHSSSLFKQRRCERIELSPMRGMMIWLIGDLLNLMIVSGPIL